jgi:chromosome segregation ATPase
MTAPTRMTAARLEELAKEVSTVTSGLVADASYCAAVRDLLAELREVTRERNEARALAFKLSTVTLRTIEQERDKLKQERDKLKQELADLDAKAGNEYSIVTHYKQERDEAQSAFRLLRGVEGEVRRQLKGRLSERNALRAELARYKAVVDAARAVHDEGMVIDENDDERHLYRDLTNALAALDQPCTQGDRKECT